MKQTEYPLLDETAFRQTLPNGLRVTVVPRKGFQKKMAYFVTDFGSYPRGIGPWVFSWVTVRW